MEIKPNILFIKAVHNAFYFIDKGGNLWGYNAAIA